MLRGFGSWNYLIIDYSKQLINSGHRFQLHCFGCDRRIWHFCCEIGQKLSFWKGLNSWKFRANLANSLHNIKCSVRSVAWSRRKRHRSCWVGAKWWESWVKVQQNRLLERSDFFKQNSVYRVQNGPLFLHQRLLLLLSTDYLHIYLLFVGFKVSRILKKDLTQQKVNFY